MIRIVDAGTFRRSVKKKGFVPADRARDHEMYFFELEGKKTSFWTKLSRGASGIRIDEISANARALGIRGDELYKILCCTFNAAQTMVVVRRSLGL